jgi:hypothetical protein
MGYYSFISFNKYSAKYGTANTSSPRLGDSMTPASISRLRYGCMAGPFLPNYACNLEVVTVPPQ